MLLDKGVDTGPVLNSVTYHILPEDTAGILLEKLSHVGAQLLLDTLPKWFRKEIQPQPQNNTGASYTKMLTKEAGEIDWKLPAVDIWRRVRAYQPWPGCYTHWQGRQLKILEAVPMVGLAANEPGTVVAVKQGGAAFGSDAGTAFSVCSKSSSRVKRRSPRKTSCAASKRLSAPCWVSNNKPKLASKGVAISVLETINNNK